MPISKEGNPQRSHHCHRFMENAEKKHPRAGALCPPVVAHAPAQCFLGASMARTIPEGCSGTVIGCSIAACSAEANFSRLCCCWDCHAGAA